jgi:hypothetical protein
MQLVGIGRSPESACFGFPHKLWKRLSMKGRYEAVTSRSPSILAICTAAGRYDARRRHGSQRSVCARTGRHHPVALAWRQRVESADKVTSTNVQCVIGCERVLIRATTLGEDEIVEAAAAGRRVLLNRAATHRQVLRIGAEIVDRARRPFPLEPVRHVTRSASNQDGRATASDSDWPVFVCKALQGCYIAHLYMYPVALTQAVDVVPEDNEDNKDNSHD